MTNVAVIARYFEKTPHGRKVSLEEFRALGPEDRRELAELAASELGLKQVAPDQYE